MASTDTIAFPAKTHTHTKSQITDFPTALKNPNSLTLKTNGTTKVTYNGASAASLDITPSAIGAAASSHSHSEIAECRYYDLNTLLGPNDITHSLFGRSFLLVWPQLSIYKIHLTISKAASTGRNILIALPIYPFPLTNIAFLATIPNTGTHVWWALNFGCSVNNPSEPSPTINFATSYTESAVLGIDFTNVFTKWNASSPVYNSYTTLTS